MINKKRMRAAYWRQRLSNAMGELKQADPQDWARWFDDDSNVPAEINDQKLALLVEARVTFLLGFYPMYKARACRDIYIWQDQFGFYLYSKEVGNDAMYTLDQDSFDAAEAFIKGLPIKHCGYGFVLDLLPTQLMANVKRRRRERNTEHCAGRMKCA